MPLIENSLIKNGMLKKRRKFFHKNS
uniref:Uncharacterized protein n=1 Tax=Arundo donax TaxID=35708 RepID=A0A0A8YA76_ARUDO